MTEEQSTDKEEMNQKDLNAARCSVEVRKAKHKCSMSRVGLETARRSVETIEGDPIRYALARVTQQRCALAPERVSPVCRPNICSANCVPRVGPGVYRVGSPCHRGEVGRQWGVANSRLMLSSYLVASQSPQRGTETCGREEDARQ